MLLDINMCHQNVRCLECLSQIASEAIWEDLNSKFSWEGGMPPDPPSKHPRFLHATIILLPSCSPAPQLKILYETNLHTYTHTHAHNTHVCTTHTHTNTHIHTYTQTYNIHVLAPSVWTFLVFCSEHTCIHYSRHSMSSQMSRNIPACWDQDPDRNTFYCRGVRGTEQTLCTLKHNHSLHTTATTTF